MRALLKIGTRGSDLALTQTKMVQSALAEHFPALKTEIVIIKTSGDWTPEQGETRLKDEDGGKGQFAKEIEQAMLADEIDIAVHSMKDMETALPAGLTIDHMLPREDPRDALLFQNPDSFDGKVKNLPAGTLVGTASVRRQAFLLAENPNLKITPLRGNVHTRIDKLKAGQVAVTMLAYAGLKRLGLAHEAHHILGIDEMLPAAGQGAVGIEMRKADTDIAEMLNKFSCQKTFLCVQAERAALSILDGSCHTPIGAHATLDGDQLHLQVKLCSLDGQVVFGDQETSEARTAEDAIAIGRAVASRIKAIAPENLLAQKIEDA